MFIKPHPFIEKVEQKEEISFSVFRLDNVKKTDTPKDKFEMVYVNSIYPTTEFNEVIYKTKGGFYLLYKTTGTTGYYSLEVYFLSNQIGPIQIFLNSILKKNDTTII
jgi:hypothetical protein